MINNLLLDKNLGLGKYIYDFYKKENIQKKEYFYIDRKVGVGFNERVFLCVKSDLINISGSNDVVWVKISIDEMEYIVFRIVEDFLQLFHCTHSKHIASIQESGFGGKGKVAKHSTKEESWLNFATPLLEMALAYPLVECDNDSDKAILNFRFNLKAVLVNGFIHGRHLSQLFKNITDIDGTLNAVCFMDNNKYCKLNERKFAIDVSLIWNIDESRHFQSFGLNYLIGEDRRNSFFLINKEEFSNSEYEFLRCGCLNFRFDTVAFRDVIKAEDIRFLKFFEETPIKRNYFHCLFKRISKCRLG